MSEHHKPVLHFAFMGSGRYVMKNARKMAFSSSSSSSSSSSMPHDDDDDVEFLIVDDVVCKKYDIQSELVCYNHSTMLGTVPSHDYVTGFHLCGDVCFPSSVKLYGNPKRCSEKGTPFKTKVQLCSEVIDEHRPEARKTVVLFDSWYTVNDVVSACKKCGFECNRDRNASVNFAARASHFEHPEQMLEELAQISGRGAAAELTAGYVNRHDLKGEGSVKKERLRESSSYPSFKPTDLFVGS